MIRKLKGLANRRLVAKSQILKKQRRSFLSILTGMMFAGQGNRIYRFDPRRHRLATRFETLETREVFAAFTPGNIALYRVGADNGPSLVNTGAQVFIDEFSPDGRWFSPSQCLRLVLDWLTI